MESPFNGSAVNWMRCFCVLGEDATLHLGIHAPEARCEALIIISLRNAELDIEASAMSTPPCP